MVLTVQKNIPRHGFRARWELEYNKLGANTNLITEHQIVAGMPDIKWHLQSSCCTSYHLLYLNIESKHEVTYETHLHYFLKPDDIDGKHNQGSSTGIKKIQLEVLSISSLSQNLLNGKLIICLDGYFSYINNSFTSLSIYNSTVTATEWGLRLKQSPKDFDVFVDGQIIEIHKFLVAAESPVFARMFDSAFQEAKENKVTITDSSLEIVKAAMDYCYRQNLSPSFFQDLNNAINLLYFCDKYDFETLKPILESHLSTTNFLTKENISLLASTADKANALQLRQSCIKFICSLLNTKNEGFSAEEIATFDPKFMADILFHALN